METLIVEDDEAYALARALAERRGTSIDEAVVASLRQALDAAPRPEPMPAKTAALSVPPLEALTPEQRASYEAMRALVRESAPFVVPGSSSDHRDLYDENGLPR
ncbi:type II toxin-antitoxin system VapB family antitoxin [Methylobacterium organophilum]|uniref:type II toxin-antitoxin system VapB family antitoxin n=1 Tax=Methylobacterium organophilum TaxID=410 RepID=UPI001F12F8C5|nr:type II toxin-antitoxin system VapB family antitoxin [Methylobacterium organophilum]UMY17898.1 type II toxin-antitoxin system VapB family antitoxin [Methylobacterium organophilum]